jgi:alkylation response protein AidB-like acyl-CoA dehydrogenase
MDFSVIDLEPDVEGFRREVEQFLDEHLTDEVISRDRRSGNGHYPPFHEALGARGWIMPMWPVAEGGAGLDPLRARILALELAWRGSMWVSVSRLITTTVALGVRAWASDALREEVLPGVARGTVLMCLGYTEPDSGSDMAAAKTRAIRVGDDWVIRGQKMFTTGAQNAQYVWLLARSDPGAPKTRGLTMFLVPLTLPGPRPLPGRSGRAGLAGRGRRAGRRAPDGSDRGPGHRRRRRPGNLARARPPAHRRRAAVGRRRPAPGRHPDDR